VLFLIFQIVHPSLVQAYEKFKTDAAAANKKRPAPSSTTKMTGNRATKAGEIIHADVCGPMEESSLRGMRFYVCFKDDFSRYICADVGVD
jgi:hypothetical protein